MTEDFSVGSDRKNAIIGCGVVTSSGERLTRLVSTRASANSSGFRPKLFLDSSDRCVSPIVKSIGGNDDHDYFAKGCSVVLAWKLAFLDQIEINLSVGVLFGDRFFPGGFEDFQCFFGVLGLVSSLEIFWFESIVVDLAEIVQAVPLPLFVGAWFVADVALHLEAINRFEERLVVFVILVAVL